MDPKYIAGSLKRESCKVLLKEFNKEFLPGSLAEHPILHLVHSEILHRVLGSMLSYLLTSSQAAVACF